MTTTQQRLSQNTWNKAGYYKKAKQASESTHPAFSEIAAYTKGRSVLEVGCGEGSKLESLPGKVKIGTDISRTGLNAAKKRLKNLVEANSENLPFSNQSIEVVVSFFTLEHFTNPEAVVLEMLRVVKVGGHLVFLAPNFGSPLGASPCFVGSRVKKLVTGLVHDLIPFSGSRLNWHSVTPISLDQGYDIDYDTTVEPYVSTLATFLCVRGCRLVTVSSQWRIPQENEKRIRKVCKVLGEHNIYPFTYWGPHLYIIAQKIQ